MSELMRLCRERGLDVVEIHDLGDEFEVVVINGADHVVASGIDRHVGFAIDAAASALRRVGGGGS